MRKFARIIILAILVSCVSTKYNLKPDAKIETLSVCINYSAFVPDSVKTKFDISLANLVSRYNAEKHAFKLLLCSDSSQSSLQINVQNTILVSNGLQVASSILTLAGLSLPFVMVAAKANFILFFYVIPNDVSNVGFKLSPELTTINMVHDARITNPGFLRKKQKQILKHAEAFDKFLTKQLKQLEKQYLRNKK